MLYLKARFIEETAAKFILLRIYANFCFITKVDYFFFPIALIPLLRDPSMMKFLIDTSCS